MKRIHLLFFILFLSVFPGCFEKPIEVNVEKVDKENKYWSESRLVFNLTLSSNEDYVNLYKSERGISMYMFCPVITGDFSVKNISEEKYKLYGYFPTDSSLMLNRRYLYKFPMEFYDRDFHSLKISKIKEILANKKCIDCRIVMAFPPLSIKNNYWSETFCIPVDSITKYLNPPDSLINGDSKE